MWCADRVLSNGARRELLVAIVVVAGAVGLTSCADDSTADAGDATVLDVTLGRFVIDPTVLTAPAGDLQLRVTNVDPDMVHDLVVHGKGTRRLNPGQSQTLDIPDVTAGEYRMWCDVPGHAAAGQTGTLVVTPATEPAAASS
jgi:plastocyanin